MKRARLIVGTIAGAMLLASSAAHTFLGWKELSDRLSRTDAPPDLVIGLQIGWMFGAWAIAASGGDLSIWASSSCPARCSASPPTAPASPGSDPAASAPRHSRAAA